MPNRYGFNIGDRVITYQQYERCPAGEVGIVTCLIDMNEKPMPGSRGTSAGCIPRFPAHQQGICQYQTFFFSFLSVLFVPLL